jgi:hypothetical protein
MSSRRQTDSGPSAESVSERWWVDSDRKRGAEKQTSTGPVGSRFFTIGKEYDQDRAHENLTDLNLKLLREAEPGEGAWGYLRLTAGRCPDQRLGWVKKQITLPPYARGVLVDSDGLLRLLVTGTPLGERVLEMTLGDMPSFDCWIEGEWVDESVFRNEEEGIAALRRLVRHYLSPEGVDQWHETHMRK